MMQKCKKLKTLGIDLVSCKEPRILELLPSHAACSRNLKLKLGTKCSRQLQSALSSTLSELTPLEKLDLSQSYRLNDKFLEGVVKNGQKLTYLDLCSD